MKPIIIFLGLVALFGWLARGDEFYFVMFVMIAIAVVAFWYGYEQGQMSERAKSSMK